MKKKILAVFLSLCMAMSLLPVTALAAETTATPIQATATTLASGDYVLPSDITLSSGALTIAKGATVTIDLAGHTLTNAANNHTIINNGTLTVYDSGTEGTIISNAAGHSALQNEPEAIATIESGKLHKTNNTSSNDYYVITNHGELTINGGTIVSDSSHSSAIENGWYTPSQNTGKTYAFLTINDGEVGSPNASGGLYTLKNDDYGIMEIRDGTFTNSTSGAGTVLNWNELTIHGGNFTATTSAVATMAQGTAGNPTYDYERGTTTIFGGNFEGILGTNTQFSAAISVVLYGGTFKENVENLCATGYAATEQDGKYVVGPKTDGMEASAEKNGTTSSAEVGGEFTFSQEDQDGVSSDASGSKIAIDVTTGNSSDEQPAPDADVTNTTVNIAPGSLTSVRDADVETIEIATDVGTITLDKQAWNTITTNATTGDTTAQVTLSIKDVTEDSESNTATYEITATANGKAVFDEETATEGTVTITVPAPTGVTQDNVHVYYLGPNGAEEVSGAKVEDKNVSWTVEHFSTYYLTGAEQVASITKNGVTTSYGTLSEAVTAAQEDDTIVLLANITDENVGTSQNKSKTVLTFDKSVTIQGNGNKISIDLSVPKTFGERDQVFSIGEDKDSKVAVTFDNVKMTVAGKEEGKGDAFDVWGTLNITKGSNITVKDAQSAFTMQGGENAKVNIDKASTVTANNIHGNFSNGGIWTIKEGSTLDINTAGNHGLSVEELTVNNSTVSVNGAAYTGILAAKVTLKKDANVTVTNCGKDLPQESQWAPDEESYKNAMELKGETPTLTVDNSTLTLTNNVNSKKESINSIYLGNGTLTQRNDPTINVDKIFTSGEATTQYYVVTYMNGNQAVGKDTVSTSSGSKEATVTLMKALPNQGYNHFVGWNDGSKTYDAGTQVTISKDTIFTAVWSYIPPANPNYRIDIPDFEGGTVTADPTAAKAGATVTLTATPDEGYAVGTITVTDRFGDAVKVTENADGTYTFTMPNGQVTVKATFVETEEPAPAEPFPDVDENDWFYDEVVYVYENGLMNGVENNQFAPNTATNRAMLATILYRLAGQPDVSGDLPFTDVEAGTWYTNAVLWAAQNGIVNGVTDTTFAPGNDLTREQLVTMLYRYAEAAGYDVSAAADLSGYPDAGKVQTYAQKAMSWAVAEGIVEGMDGNLNPAGSATRAQIATILMRFCEGVGK